MSETNIIPQRIRNRRKRLKAITRKKGLLPYRRRRSTKQHLFQIAVIIIALYCYKQFDRSPVYCKNASDPLCPDKYFNDNYTDARDQFLALSETIQNANSYHLPIYKLENGDYLFTDITIINENSKSDHLIIHVCGTHGVEGYAGSAIQLSLLEYISNVTNHQPTCPLFENYTFTNNFQCNTDLDTMDANTPIIMFVHALNPYGFHFKRRFNENNVDLNRNYKTKQQWETLMAKDKSVFGYEDLNGFFNPKYDLKYVAEISEKLPSSKFVRGVWIAWYYWIVFIKAAYYSVTVGQSRIASSMIAGQWHDPNGLQYNGQPFKLEKSHELLQDFIANKLFEEKHFEWKEQINKISLMDIHTGIGKYGWDTLIGDNDNDVEKLKVLMPNHVKKNLIVQTQDLYDGAYENVNGLMCQHIIDLVQTKLNDKSMDNLMVTQEFGTYDGKWVFAAMRLENGITAAYNKYVEEIQNMKLKLNDTNMEQMNDLVNITRKRCTPAFYVNYVDWKTEIVKRGFDLFTQIFNR